MVAHTGKEEGSDCVDTGRRSVGGCGHDTVPPLTLCGLLANDVATTEHAVLHLAGVAGEPAEKACDKP